MTTATLTVTTFVLARIAEDEEVAQAFRDGNSWGNPYAGDGDGSDVAYSNRFDEARVLAQSAAMRKIVERINARRALGIPTETMVLILLDLASIWSDHPDWREEWRA